MNYNTVTVPHINVNDVEVTLVEWHKEVWDRVKKGDTLCTVETTKAAVDIDSEYDGYLYIVRDQNDIIKVGEPLAHILKKKDDAIIKDINNIGNENSSSKIVTKSAEKLIRENGLSLDDFENHSVIQSDTVIAHLRKSQANTIDEPSSNDIQIINNIEFNEKSTVLYCAENHALLALDAFLSHNDYEPVLILMDKVVADEMHGIPVISVKSFPLLSARSLAYIYYREEATNELKNIIEFCDKEKIKRISCIHFDSSVSKLSFIGEGAFIGANVTVGPEVKIGKAVQLLAGCSIAHHSQIDDYAVIADGTHIGGNVKIGKYTSIGIGVSINKRVSIGSNCTIVSGATVIDHLPDSTILRNN